MKHFCENCKNRVKINEIYHTLHSPIRYFCCLNCYKNYVDSLRNNYFPN